MSLMAKTAAAGGGTLLPDVLEFTSSLALDKGLAQEDLIGSLAHVIMLGRTKIIPQNVARTLHSGLINLFAASKANTLEFPADEEDVHMAIEARLSEMHPAEAPLLHTGRSRNDQVALTVRLHVREQCIQIERHLLELVGALVACAKDAGELELPSYTHRQRAQPIRLAYWYLAYATAFMRDAKSFAAAREESNECPLGSGAIAGSTLPLDRALTSSLLSFSRPTQNGLDTVGDRDFALAYTFATARFLVHASRLSTDIIDFSTSEFGFVKLADAIACGSSMMPQKKNPDLFELVRGKSARGIGNMLNLFVLMKGLPGGYNRDQQEDRQVLLETGPLAKSVTHTLKIGLANIRFDKARCEAALASDMTQATDLAEALVKRGIPFRVAYQAVGKLVRYAMDAKIPLSAVPHDVAARENPEFAHADVLACLEVLGASARKQTAGSTGAAAIATQMTDLLAEVERRTAALAVIPSLDALFDRLKEAAL